MTLTPRLRRGIIASSVATAALLLPAIALASSGTSSGASDRTATTANATAVHRCHVTELRAWLGIPGSGTAGSTYYDLELSNISSQTCTLYGYPGVSALRDGHQVGSPAGREPMHPSRLVTLAPGASSHVLLQIADVSNYPPSTCAPTTATELRVYAPGDFGALTIPFTFPACGSAGPVFLDVTADATGTGIPGYRS